MSAEDIVTALAALSVTYYDEYNGSTCALCWTIQPDKTDAAPAHELDCPWLLAALWVLSHHTVAERPDDSEWFDGRR